MYISKLSPSLQLALRYEALLAQSSKNVFIAEDGRWELIVEYGGEIETIERELNLTVIKLSNEFATVLSNKRNIEALSNYTAIISISLPSEVTYMDIGLSQVCGSTVGQPGSKFNVRGAGVLLGVVDSGIRYNHPDFIKEDGTTRIRYLWDQTLAGTPPTGFNRGSEYTEDEINQALRAEGEEAALAIVPSQDIIGHGTGITGIAAGNGRASNGQNRGVAPECELIIVKIGREGSDGLQPRDLDLMEGISYVIQKAIELQMPISVLIGAGSNLTGHDGLSPVEQLINELTYNWQCNFSVGVGNQANKDTHTSGILVEGQSEVVQFVVEGQRNNLAIVVWKEFIDEIELVVQSPQGEMTEVLSLLTPNRAFLFRNTAVLINFTEPIVDITRQEIFIWFQSQGDEPVSNGIWTLNITGTKILEGKYNIWSQVTDDNNRFINGVVEQSIMSPATSEKVTSVAAFDSRTLQLASFSGRGYTRDNKVKPDIAAPGVNVTVPSIERENLYGTLTGTSCSAAFVAGTYVLMMSYGLIQLGGQNFYGERLKIYLLRNARRISNYGPYPNKEWGYGTLCIDAALNNILEVISQST